MKKFFLAMALALPLVFTSCKEDAPLEVPASVEMNVYATNDLAVSGTWTSSNEFVATVDKNGNVTAHHVGEAVLTVVDGTQTATCKVVVNPVNTSYTFPYFGWGEDLDAVKNAAKGLTLLEEVSDEEGGWILSYLTGSEFPGYIYFVPTKGLEAASIVVDINDTENFEGFLYQYFADYEEDEEGWCYLINANSVAEATIAVQYGWNDETSIIATFMPYTEETRSGDIKAMFKVLDFEKSAF